MAKIKVRKGRGSPMPGYKGEKRREARARMEWLMDFLNKDIDSLHSVDCVKLLIDILAFIRGWSSSAIIDTYLPALKVNARRGPGWHKEILNKTQLELKGFLMKILFARIMMEQYSTIPIKQIGPEPEFEGPPGFGTYELHYNVLVTKDEVVTERIVKDRESIAWLDEEISKTCTDTGLLAYSLIELLREFPLSRIKTCDKPGCGNFFYQKTIKSKGDFCSRKCQNWANTNRWRENNREKYNKYHRDRRAKTKEDQVAVKCRACGFQQLLGSLEDLIQGIFPDIKKCPTCGEMPLHFIRIWEKEEWIEGEPFGSFEWEEFLRSETPIQEG